MEVDREHCTSLAAYEDVLNRVSVLCLGESRCFVYASAILHNEVGSLYVKMYLQPKRMCSTFPNRIRHMLINT